MARRFAISRRDEVDALYPRMRDAHAYLAGAARDPAKHDKSPIHYGRKLAGVAAGAGLTGLLTGRLNHWNWPNTPIPIGLSLAVGALAVDYLDLVGPLSEDVGNAGVGALASWINMLATGAGQQWRASAGLPTGEGQPITAGIAGIAGAIGCCGQPAGPIPSLPARPRMPTEAEIAAMSHAMR